MTQIPPVSRSTPSSQSQPENLHALAAAAWLFAQLAQSAPTSEEMPK